MAPWPRPPRTSRTGSTAGPTGSRGAPSLLVILGGVASISLLFTLPGIPALVIGIVAASTWRRNPERSRKLTTIGYAVFVGIVLLQIVATVLDVGSRS